MSKFNVGDLVVADGKLGVVRAYHNSVAVRHFIKDLNNLHNLNGLCEHGYGWFYEITDVLPYEIKVNSLNKLLYPDYLEYEGYLIPKEAYETLTHKKK